MANTDRAPGAMGGNSSNEARDEDQIRGEGMSLRSNVRLFHTDKQ